MGEVALLIVDMQNDYFPGGRWPLAGAEEAATRAAGLLAAFRAAGEPVIHIRHESTREPSPFFTPGTPGAEIHPSLAPERGEATIVKNFPNSFRSTGLHEVLEGWRAEHLVIVGAMTHMCIDATVRAAADLGYRVTVAGDACATRALEFRGREVSADDVQAAYLAALAFGYASVITADEAAGLVSA
ncbi:Isochorismatase [Haematobacter massiliensis]|uniref:Isochorismatase n=1 Tax=Haematobacter massiliensis TaxID=195105 RepID=A0A086YCU6_9RHOB|nr:cysteine hydrolase family protein [Haematobacter massiliensis]KFI32096.1 Isochorismatase [Haematobacter massiliensis]OWJ85740.1 cysteine hydrolase [Haematobacter massiliensis]QBJ24480.1 cysteine hydrolase [Haematobacter massiliensis]